MRPDSIKTSTMKIADFIKGMHSILIGAVLAKNQAIPGGATGK
jgi:hypothetical protein